MMLHSESIAALAAAMSKAQGEITPAKKDSENPFFHSRYADLASVWDACRAALSQNGFAVIQSPRTACSDGVTLVTVGTLLAHSSGEWLSEELSAVPVKDDPQGIGSCITYLRRYSLAAFVGVAPEDDDAEAASSHDTKAAPRKAQAGNGHKPPAKPTTGPVQISVMLTTIRACESLKSLCETLDALPSIFGETLPEDLKTAGREQCEALSLLAAKKTKDVPKLKAFVQATRYLTDEQRDRVLVEIGEREPINNDPRMSQDVP